MPSRRFCRWSSCSHGVSRRLWYSWQNGVSCRGTGFRTLLCGQSESVLYLVPKKPHRPRVGGPVPCCYATFSMVFVHGDGSRVMKQPSFQSIALILFIPLLSGCQYDRSFMHLDSNSGAPFFGLQFAVDSGSRPPSADSESTASGIRAVIPNRTLRHGIEPLTPPGSDSARQPLRMTLVSQREVGGDQMLEHTSSAAAFNGRIRYTLPQDNSGHRSIAERVDLRRAAF